MRRHELSDAQWKIVEPLMPKNGRRGGQWKDHRVVLNGILWRTATGAPWRDLPDRYGPWQTVYERFNRWCRDGRWARIVEALQIRLDERGLIDADLWCVDGTIVRATRAAAGGGKKGGAEPEDHALGRSCGGFSTKIHFVTDGRGVPLVAHLTAGQVHDSTQLEAVVTAVCLPNGRKPKRLAGDKGYSAARIRQWLQGRAIEPVIPYRDDERRRNPQGTHSFDGETYRRRNVIERCIGWLKEYRAVGTRYDKLAVNFLATVHVAMIHRYLRLMAVPGHSIMIRAKTMAELGA